MKKKILLPSDLAERLEEISSSMPGAARLTVTGSKSVLVENHRAVMSFTPDELIISFGRGRLCVYGSALSISAMNGGELLVSGTIRNIEWL